MLKKIWVATLLVSALAFTSTVAQATDTQGKPMTHPHHMMTHHHHMMHHDTMKPK